MPQEKTGASDKVHSGMSFSAIGYEFEVSKSGVNIKYFTFKQKRIRNKDRYWLDDKNNVTKGWQGSNSASLSVIQCFLTQCS